MIDSAEASVKARILVIDNADVQQRIRKDIAHGGAATGAAVYFLGLGWLRGQFKAR